MNQPPETSMTQQPDSSPPSMGNLEDDVLCGTLLLRLLESEELEPPLLPDDFSPEKLPT
jgi:hypothetical protein